MTTSASLAHFTLAYWCVLAAAVLPMVCALLAKLPLLAAPGEPPFDNADPRGWMARQTGARARALAAQSNSFEALPFFIGAVVIAHQLGAAQAWLDGLAVAFILARVAYIGLYISGIHTLRSMVWGVGFVVNVAILFAAYR